MDWRQTGSKPDPNPEFPGFLTAGCVIAFPQPCLLSIPCPDMSVWAIYCDCYWIVVIASVINTIIIIIINITIIIIIILTVIIAIIIITVIIIVVIIIIIIIIIVIIVLSSLSSSLLSLLLEWIRCFTKSPYAALQWFLAMVAFGCCLGCGHGNL